MRLRHAITMAAAAIIGASVVWVPPATAVPDPAPAGQLIPMPPADGSVPAGFASWDEVYAYQLGLNAAAHRLTDADPSADSGFAGVVASPLKRSIQVWWKGPLPSSVQRVLAEVRSSIHVDVYAAKHSAAETRAAIDRISKIAGSAADGLASLEPRFDGGGVRVSVTGDAPAAELTAAAGGVAVETVRVAGKQRPTAPRYNDSPRYYAGGQWGVRNRSTFCSTGFGVLHGGVSRLLSAGHCGYVGMEAVDGGGLQSDVMGNVIRKYTGLDSMIIDARSMGRMFDGNYYTTFYKPVVGTYDAVPGNLLCSSGAFSGTICGLTVLSYAEQIRVESPPGTVFTVYYAQRVRAANGPVWGNGDSGGPVFGLASNPAQVLAVGIITSGVAGTDTWCQGVPAAGTRACSQEGHYVRIQQILGHWGATLLTSSN